MASWSLPAVLDAWYLVAGRDEIGPGQLRSFTVGAPERGIVGVLSRTPRGLFALEARCPHMGADLRAGNIDGKEIVCPLHGMRFGADGRCDRLGVKPARVMSVEERCGAVFVHPSAPKARAPALDRWPEGDIVWSKMHTERVAVPWQSVLVNAFDLHHLRAVHRRELAGEPVFDTPAPDRLRMRYATRVIGGGLSDRVTQALSGDRIDIWLSCVGGTVLIVEVDLGWVRTVAVVGVAPCGDGSVLRISVGVGCGALGALRARVARWLYITFLRRDIPVLAGVSLQPRSALPEDAPVQRLVDFLEAQPAL